MSGHSYYHRPKPGRRGKQPSTQTSQLQEDGKVALICKNNDSRFLATEVQKYLADNHLNKVFTHPYTPEENGHIESFHAILGRSLDCKQSFTFIELETHLQNFYHIYNNIRLHGSLDHLTPVMFWNLWEGNFIVSTPRKNKPLGHKLKVHLYQLSGNGNLMEISGLPGGQTTQTQAIAI
ncbi:MAG: transposase [Bacteroidetes bacterium]|jgi:hypothetical protein|nr:transposase [Bacteroidota bacterium]